MEQVIKTAEVIVPLIVGIVAGFFLKKKGVLNTESTDSIKTLINDYLMPLNLGFSMAIVELSFSVLMMPVIGFTMNILCFLMAFVMKKLMREENHYFPYLQATFENGLLGINLFPVIFPSMNGALLASMDLGFCIFFFFLYLPHMKGSLKGGDSFLNKMKKVLSSRILQGILIGLLINVTGLSKLIMGSFAGGIVTASVELLTAVIVPMALFLVGYEISLDRKTMALVLKTSLARILTTGLVCAVMLFILNALGILDRDMSYAIIFVSSLPAPLMLSVFAGDDRESGYINAEVSTYIAVTIVTVAVLLMFL